MGMYQQSFQKAVRFVTARPSSKDGRGSRIWLAVLFITGIVIWGFFLNWGNGSINFHDWAVITAPRFTFLRNAVSTGQLPLHAAYPIAMGNTSSNRIMAIPDLLLSPQILLLPFMSVAQFALFQICLLYAVGFFGLLRLRKMQNWSLLTFSIVFFLFDFNGHIMDHFAVGHLNWGGYFLFSWFAVLIFEVFDRKPGWRWVAKMALVLFAVLLQGSYHQFIYMLFFLGFFALAFPKHFWVTVEAAFASVLLSLVRLLPEISLLSSYNNKFISGYPSLDSILSALVTVDYPAYRMIQGVTQLTGTWETSMYIGLIGALFVVMFGILRVLTSSSTRSDYRRLLLPVAGIVVLSLNSVYKTLRTVIALPPLTGERVVTRMIALAFAFLLFLAAVEFQRWLDRKNTSLLAIGVTITLVVAGLYELSGNFFQWMVTNTARYYSYTDFNAYEWTISNRWGDAVYLNLILIGFIVTLLSAGFLAFMAWREAHSFIPNALPEAAPEALPETDQPAFPLPESQPALNSFTGTLETFPGKRATRQ